MTVATSRRNQEVRMNQPLYALWLIYESLFISDTLIKYCFCMEQVIIHYSL